MRSLSALLPAAARLLLGGVFTVFGLSGFFHFLPPPPHPPAAQALHQAFVASGYLYALIKGTEVGAGLLLLANRFVPLALVVLAPVLVNIVAFHVFLAPASLAAVLPLVAAALFLAWTRRDAFAPLFAAGGAATTPVEPSGAPAGP
jgi:uncharacterized membrane protein YphA (DoxX/SURF4 family)